MKELIETLTRLQKRGGDFPSIKREKERKRDLQTFMIPEIVQNLSELSIFRFSKR